jgi:hypothetical protein
MLRRSPQEVFTMFVTTTHHRTLVASTALAAVWFTLAIPAATAAPKPQSLASAVNDRNSDINEFVAELRAAGFTAQAANNAAQLTYRH